MCHDFGKPCPLIALQPSVGCPPGYTPLLWSPPGPAILLTNLGTLLLPEHRFMPCLQDLGHSPFSSMQCPKPLGPTEHNLGPWMAPTQVCSIFPLLPLLLHRQLVGKGSEERNAWPLQFHTCWRLGSPCSRQPLPPHPELLSLSTLFLLASLSEVPLCDLMPSPYSRSHHLDSSVGTDLGRGTPAPLQLEIVSGWSVKSTHTWPCC